eukprot:TRINITY_DN6508_c0_g1_i1.p2 TRINITY_DN6508_c0_g1~~TRINITY_DN6508_c0_g1_i1.p2  ORF type:complete len:342 (-),score=107.12 TRINITY_DN6508_c0_g1_i1:1805-2830(-)
MEEVEENTTGEELTVMFNNNNSSSSRKRKLEAFLEVVGTTSPEIELLKSLDADEAPELEWLEGLEIDFTVFREFQELEQKVLQFRSSKKSEFSPDDHDFNNLREFIDDVVEFERRITHVKTILKEAKERLNNERINLNADLEEEIDQYNSKRKKLLSCLDRLEEDESASMEALNSYEEASLKVNELIWLRNIAVANDFLIQKTVDVTLLHLSKFSRKESVKSEALQLTQIAQRNLQSILNDFQKIKTVSDELRRSITTDYAKQWLQRFELYNNLPIAIVFLQDHLQALDRFLPPPLPPQQVEHRGSHHVPQQPPPNSIPSSNSHTTTRTAPPPPPPTCCIS